MMLAGSAAASLQRKASLHSLSRRMPVRLGRERVVILTQGKLEIPSDILGVVVLEFEESVDEVREGVRQRLSGVGLID